MGTWLESAESRTVRRASAKARWFRWMLMSDTDAAFFNQTFSTIGRAS